MCVLRIYHHYDIGDQSSYIERRSGGIDAKRAALYCQFRCEEWFGASASLSNFGIASLLVDFYGFQHCAPPGESIFAEIDMYVDREDAVGNLYSELMKDDSLHR